MAAGNGPRGPPTRRSDGSVPAKGIEGLRFEWNPREIAGGAKLGVEQYRARETSIAPGEKIVWGRNSAELGLTNGYVLAVAAVEPDG